MHSQSAHRQCHDSENDVVSSQQLAAVEHSHISALPLLAKMILHLMMYTGPRTPVPTTQQAI